MSGVQPTPAATRSAYRALAPLYDAFTSEHDYEGWTERLEERAVELGLRGRSLLDVACGTGKSFLPFLSRGYAVTACDLSPEMVALAAAKAPTAGVFVADVRELGRLGSFSLVTCLDDSLNYLHGERDLAAALRSLAANLAPGGVCVFDLNTLRAYRTTFACHQVHEDDGVVFVWRGESGADAEPGCAASATIEAFRPAGGSLYERVASRHVQRHFPRALVERLLADAGLRCADVRGQRPDGSLDPEPDELRHHKLVFFTRHAEREEVTRE
jgi:SAM-dependent methyltransferase